MALRDFNWVGSEELRADAGEGIAVFARVRSTRPPAAAVLRLGAGTAVVDLAADETGVAPGQACVLYDGDGPDACVLGGGTIDARIGSSHCAEAA